MKIPEYYTKDGKKYEFVKKYPNYFMYQDVETKIKICFLAHDLGLCEEVLEKTKNIDPSIKSVCSF